MKPDLHVLRNLATTPRRVKTAIEGIEILTNLLKSSRFPEPNNIRKIY